jgi:hypothetical protein
MIRVDRGVQAIDIKTARSYWWRMGCLGAILGGIALIFLASGVRSLLNPSPYGDDLGSVAFRTLVIVAMCAFPAFVLRHFRRRWVTRIDERGVTRRDGKVFAWSGFKGVKAIRRKGTGPINHYELHFQDGSAHVYHQVIENAREVLAVVTALERGPNPFL